MSATILTTFAWLAIAHFICDFPLQGDYLAKAKNRWSPVPGTPWPWALAAHAAIHAGAVWLITGYWWMAAVEFFAHAWIDDSKCTRKIGFTQDQLLHLILKLAFAADCWRLS